MSDANHIYHKEGCPFADRAIQLLDRHQISYQTHVFADQAEEDQFKQQHGVTTTPQIFLDGQRIGGYDELASHLSDQAG